MSSKRLSSLQRGPGMSTDPLVRGSAFAENEPYIANSLSPSSEERVISRAGGKTASVITFRFFAVSCGESVWPFLLLRSSGN